MPPQNSYSYASTTQAARTVNWSLDDLIGGPHQLDFRRPFLPEALARTGELRILSATERLTLNQIRGATYLHLFGLVEEFVVPFVVSRAHVSLLDKARARALLTFAEDEAKHQQLFERFGNSFQRDFGTRLQLIGPATEIAEQVLQHSPLAIAILTLHLHSLRPRHQLESVETAQRLDPSFLSVLDHHWQTEPQHPKLHTLLTGELARTASPKQILSAIDEFLELVQLLDDSFQQQVVFDRKALEAVRRRRFSTAERERIETVQLSSYRWTFLVSGLEQESFVTTLKALSEPGLERVQQATRALS